MVECSGKREGGGEIGDSEKMNGQQEMPQFDQCYFSIIIWVEEAITKGSIKGKVSKTSIPKGD